MASNKYFREELAYLREKGVEYSKIHPHLSKFLHGKKVDPDIERLMEGFAFLTSRLREKIDDEFPELTHSMINMLWPNYLRPIPSMTIIQFTPDHSITSRYDFSESVEIESTKKLGTQCKFRTCRKFELYPLKIENLSFSHSQIRSIIELELVSLGNASIDKMDINDLRFYLGGDKYSAQMLYLWLNHSLEKIELLLNEQWISVPTTILKPVGFEGEDAILPYPKNVYEGYRVLQEYLAYQDAFLFFDLKSLGKWILGKNLSKISIRFVFSKVLPSEVRIQDDAFQLFCTPAINLFNHNTEPVNMTGKEIEYKLYPSAGHPSHYEIFSVDRVEGRIIPDGSSGKEEFRLYQSFESFQHAIERTEDKNGEYYRVRLKESVLDKGFDHYMSFVRSDEEVCIGISEVISVVTTCTNRQLPLELGKGDVRYYTNNTPAMASFQNITVPTQPLRPELDGGLLWTLISNLSLNYLSLLSKDALAAILKVYDFRALVDRQAERIAQNRLDGISEIETKPIEKLFKGLVVRGLQSKVILDQDYFGSEGDLYMFGTVLSRFFTLYASINSFHELIVVNKKNQEEYQWGTQLGIQPLI